MSDISELTARVEKLERTVETLLKRLGMNYNDSADAYLYPEVLELARQGKKIEAIKVYREMTGTDLKTAKDFVDSLG
jgi:ribosomal protein L7/L12